MGALKQRTLRERVAAELRSAIVEGRLGPGEPIRLQATARKLDVSMTPVRECLIELEREGLVCSEADRGFRVAPFEVGEVNELYPLIWLLETEALRADPPAGSALAELRELNGSLRAAKRARERLELDRRFHETLLGGCRNGLLLEMLDGLRRRAWRYELAYMADAAAPTVSADQHDQIVGALAAGELEEAVRVLEANWRVGPEFLVPWLRAREEA